MTVNSSMTTADKTHAFKKQQAGTVTTGCITLKINKTREDLFSLYFILLVWEGHSPPLDEVVWLYKTPV